MTRDRISYGIFFAVVIVTGFLVENYYYLQLITIIGINTLLALGLNMLLGYAGQISLGHAAFYGIGAYTTGILTVNYGLNPWIALFCAILLTILVSVIVGFPTLKLTGYYLGMGTLGFGMIVHIVLREWSSFTGGASGFMGIPPLEIGPISFFEPRNCFYLVWFTVVSSFILCKRIINSRMGRALKAIHDSENAAKAMGINTRNMKLKIFVFSAVLSALAGFFYAHMVSFISPESFSFLVSVKIVTMVVVGGMASIWGSLLGASLLTMLPEWLHSFSDFEMVVYGLILMVVMIITPQGLTRGILDIYERSKSTRNKR